MTTDTAGSPEPRSAPATAAVMTEKRCRQLVAERSGGDCELRLPGCLGRAVNLSHRKPRSQGGRWTAENVLDSCGSGVTGCHGWVESHPRDAHVFGFRVWRIEDPLLEPVLHGDHGWVLLAADGSVVPVSVEDFEAS